MLFTKAGDKGETTACCYDGTPVTVSKDSLFCNLVGTLDELSSMVGLVRAYLRKDIKAFANLVIVQRYLYELGVYIYNPKRPDLELLRASFSKDVVRMEQLITLLYPSNSSFKFILPGGCIIGARLHCIRTMVRKMERFLVAYNQILTIPEEFLQWANRLSDYFYALALHINHVSNVEELLADTVL